MAADANIFAQYLRPAKSMQDYSNDMDAAEQNRLTLQSGRMKAQQDQLAVEDDNALRSAYQQSGGDNNALLKILQGGGRYKAAEAVQKRIQESAKATADLGETDAKTDKMLTETQAAKLTQHNNLLVNVQSPEDGAAWVQLGVQNGSIKPENAPMLLQTFQRTKPEQFGDTINKLALGMKDYIEKNKPTYTTQGLGDRSQILATPGLGGAPSIVSSSQINQSPDSVASNLTSTENNKRTVGASLANAAAVREAAKTTGDATKAAASIQRDQATEMKLADDYRAQSKAFGESSSAYKQINATLDSATTSPAATLAAATKFMKILDPGSVVRESELGMALAASGVIDRAVNYMSTLQSGQKLTKTQAADFKDISGKMFKAAQQVQQTIDADYKAKAKAYGLRPEMVTQDLGQNTDQAAGWSITKVPK